MRPGMSGSATALSEKAGVISLLDSGLDQRLYRLPLANAKPAAKVLSHCRFGTNCILVTAVSSNQSR